MRIALTDEERSRYLTGSGVETDGVKNFTTRHMNLKTPLSYAIAYWAPRHCRRCKSTNWVDGKDTSVCLDCGQVSP